MNRMIQVTSRVFDVVHHGIGELQTQQGLIGQTVIGAGVEISDEDRIRFVAILATVVKR